MENHRQIAYLNWLLSVVFLIWIIFLPSSCREKKQSEASLTIKNSATTTKSPQKYVGIFVTDDFESNLRYIDMVGGYKIEADSIFEIIIENVASRDTLGNWKIYDSKRAVEILWQLYLTQIHDKIKITHK